MFAFFLVAAVLPTMILGHAIVPCPGGHPVPTGLRITGCNAAPCNVNQGESMTYAVDFVPTAASPTMTLSIFSTALGEEVEVPLPPVLSSACNGMSPGCPVVAGQQVTQTATIPVSSEHHGGIPVQLRVLMTNAANAINTCCLISLIIH